MANNERGSIWGDFEAGDIAVINGEYLRRLPDPEFIREAMRTYPDHAFDSWQIVPNPTADERRRAIPAVSP